MIQTTVGNLLAGDTLRFSERGSKEYTLTGTYRSGEDGDLFELTFRDAPDMTMPFTTPVWAVHQHRLIPVFCLLCKYPSKVGVNIADGINVQAVVCGDCDVETTRQVIAKMQED